MKKMNTKKAVLWVGLAALVLLIATGVGAAKLNLTCTYETNIAQSAFGGYIPNSNGERYPDIIYHERAKWCEPLALVLVSLLPLLLLSLITYRMHDHIFRAWWNFARWWVPVIVLVTLLLNNHGSGGGYIGMDTAFDGLIYSILYGVLVITSIVKIVRAYGKK